MTTLPKQLLSVSFRVAAHWHRKKGHRSAAAQYAARALSLDPESHRNHQLMGYLALDQKNPAEAMHFIVLILEHKPANRKSRKLFRRTLKSFAGSFDMACRALNLAYKNKTPTLPVLLDVADLGLRQSRFQEVEKLLKYNLGHRSLSGSFSDCLEFHMRLAEAGDFSRAVLSLEQYFPEMRAQWEWQVLWAHGDAEAAYTYLSGHPEILHILSQGDLKVAADIAKSRFDYRLLSIISTARVNLIERMTPGGADHVLSELVEIETRVYAGFDVKPMKCLRRISRSAVEASKQGSLSSHDILRLARAFLQRYDPKTSELLAAGLPVAAQERRLISRYASVVRGPCADFSDFYEFAAEHQSDIDGDEVSKYDILFSVPWNFGTHFLDGSEAVERSAAQIIFGRTFALAKDFGLKVAAVPAPARRLPQVGRDPCILLSFHTYGGRNVLHVKLGSIPGAMLIDSGGYSGWASAADLPIADLPLEEIDEAQAIAWLERERATRMASNESKYRQSTSGALSPSSTRSVFCALQIPGDTVQNLAWIPMFEYFRAIVIGWWNTGTTVIIKRHPRCRDPQTSAFLRWASKYDHVRITDSSIFDIFAAVDAVYVVNSGVGAEALIHNLPVHIAGKTDYRHACHETRRIEDLTFGPEACKPKLSSAHNARYMWWYMKDFHVPTNNLEAIDSRILDFVIKPAIERRNRV